MSVIESNQTKTKSNSYKLLVRTRACMYALKFLNARTAKDPGILNNPERSQKKKNSIELSGV